MDASGLTATETIPASRKLGEDRAQAMLSEASKLIVAKGKKLREWEGDALREPEALAAMLGPTGNLRAPTLRVGTTLLVGFNEDAYSAVFGN